MKALHPSWPQPNNIHAFTTLKNCGFEDLNLINTSNIPFWLEQEHGVNILSANNTSTTVKADGSFTQQKNIICVVKTADCLPILITNKQGNFVAAIHAGWRGLSKGIIENFFIQTKDLNLKYQDLLFWLGPAIGPLVFEVGEDVLQKFDYSYNIAFKKINDKQNKYLANIYQIAKIALSKFEINNNQIFSENLCTYSQPELFYSYRREPSNSNRMLSLIWID